MFAPPPKKVFYLGEGPLEFIEHFDTFAETHILSAIEYGDAKTLEHFLDSLDHGAGEIPPLDRDADRAFKNIFIFSTGQVLRAAVKGGLDLDTAYTLADHYLFRIEAREGYAAVFSLLKQMFLDFAQRVAMCRRLAENSPLARKIGRVITANLYEKISPTDIAGILKMNCSYLCKHFKQETGKTITEYINEVKITEGKRLLKSTEHSIVQIAVQLGYASQTYFQTVFKKNTGLTPKQFRDSGP